MSKKNKRGATGKREIRSVTANDWPTRWEKIRLAAENEWRAEIPSIVEKFLSLLWKNSSIPPFEIAPNLAKRRKQIAQNARIQDILHETGARMYAEFASANERTDWPRWKQNYVEKLFEKSRGSKKKGASDFLRRWNNAKSRAEMPSWERDYAKALFGKLRGSEKKRAESEFRRCWYKAEMARWKQDYDKALFGKLRGSEKKRAALEFLRCWYNAEIHDRESGADVETVTITVPLRIIHLARLLAALNRHDADFLKGLAEAVGILEQLAYSNKNREPTTLGRWLLEYAMQNGWQPTHTARELNEQYVSKFRVVSDKKLRARCRELGVPLKPDARGTRAVRYKASNGTPMPRKKG
jgi:hypothetical protein